MWYDRKKGGGVMGRRKKAICLLLLALALLGVLAVMGLQNRLVVRSYAITSEKLTAPVRVVFLSDLHSCDYGEGQAELLELVAAQEPDLVLLGGDWVDDEFDRLDPERAYTAATALAERWPTYYVTGNHEHWSGQAEAIKARMTACGVTVLAGEAVTVELEGQRLQICGLDDPAVGETVWKEQMEALRAVAGEEAFSILLSHRPERLGDYGGFDLAFSGHAHGGQWRIPGLLNGLFAPDQGFFPKYAGGAYGLDGGGQLVVGRGLARESTRVSRLYNPPEIVVVDLLPVV